MGYKEEQQQRTKSNFSSSFSKQRSLQPPQTIIVNVSTQIKRPVQKTIVESSNNNNNNLKVNSKPSGNVKKVEPSVVQTPSSSNQRGSKQTQLSRVSSPKIPPPKSLQPPNNSKIASQIPNNSNLKKQQPLPHTVPSSKIQEKQKNENFQSPNAKQPVIVEKKRSANNSRSNVAQSVQKTLQSPRNNQQQQQQPNFQTPIQHPMHAQPQYVPNAYYPQALPSQMMASPTFQPPQMQQQQQHHHQPQQIGYPNAYYPMNPMMMTPTHPFGFQPTIMQPQPYQPQPYQPQPYQPITINNHIGSPGKQAKQSSGNAEKQKIETVSKVSNNQIDKDQKQQQQQPKKNVNQKLPETPCSESQNSVSENSIKKTLYTPPSSKQKDNTNVLKILAELQKTIKILENNNVQDECTKTTKQLKTILSVRSEQAKKLVQSTPLKKMSEVLAKQNPITLEDIGNLESLANKVDDLTSQQKNVNMAVMSSFQNLALMIKKLSEEICIVK